MVRKGNKENYRTEITGNGRVLVLSDSHFGSHEGNGRDKESIRQKAKNIARIIDEQKIQYVVLLGDIIETSCPTARKNAEKVTKARAKGEIPYSEPVELKNHVAKEAGIFSQVLREELDECDMSSSFFYVPGNHDYPITEEQIRDLLPELFKGKEPLPLKKTPQIMEFIYAQDEKKDIRACFTHGHLAAIKDVYDALEEIDVEKVADEFLEALLQYTESDKMLCSVQEDEESFNSFSLYWAKLPKGLQKKTRKWMQKYFQDEKKGLPAVMHRITYKSLKKLVKKRKKLQKLLGEKKAKKLINEIDIKLKKIFDTEEQALLGMSNLRMTFEGMNFLSDILAHRGDFDFVIMGHSHRPKMKKRRSRVDIPSYEDILSKEAKKKKKEGKYWQINSGSVVGNLEKNGATVAVLDMKEKKSSLYEVSGEVAIPFEEFQKENLQHSP